MGRSLLKLPTAIAFFLLVSRVSAHGLISWPRQRGLMGYNSYGLKVLTTDAPADYCPHCLNGGGPGAVKENSPNGKWTPYEPTNPNFRFRDDHGLCGDPKGNGDHMAGGRFVTGSTVATYEEGDYIDMESHVSAHHNGYFEFFVCSLDCCGEGDLSKKCFQNGCCKKLMRAPHQSCESGFDRICGPVDPNYPGRWYLPPRDQDAPGENWFGGLNKKMRYALPQGMTCDKCVVHWAWTTANSCNPPGYAEYKFPSKWKNIPGDGGSVGGINKSFGTCGDEGAIFPEEFWSCSENIRIVKKNSGKDRTLQYYHNGEMNAEGPDDSTSSLLMKPLKEPVSVPLFEEPEEEVPGFSPNPSVSPSQTPTAVLKTGTEESTNESNENMDQSETSSYDLSQFLKSYDTGVCMAREDTHYCQACLDLGYGLTKCFWCTRDSSGTEVCLHERP